MIDHHAHPFDREFVPFEPTRVAIDLQDMDDGRPDAPIRPDNVWRALLCSRLADRLDVPFGEVAAARDERAREDWAGWVGGLFADTSIDTLVLDPSYPPVSEEHIDELAALSGCRVRFLWRVDPVVDDGLERGAPAEEIIADVEAGIREAAASDHHVGLKTVIAYRSGLGVRPGVDPEEAAASLEAGGPGADKPLRDLLFGRLLEAAADTGMPLQVHTGFGDSDLRLATADPTLLEPVLDTTAGGEAPVVLLHSGYPFQDQAAYLAAARRNVFVDLSLVNVLAPATVTDGMRRLVGLAPLDRVMFATDAYVLPEAHWFAEGLLREAWREVRADLEGRGMDPGWLDDAGRAAFTGNAARLYGLGG